jgi:predicted nucleotidyltransferase
MLATLLGSATRARVLTLLLAHPRRTYHLRESIRLAGGGASGVQREVERLEGLGLVVSERTTEGRRALRVVDEHPLLEPLQALVDAEAGALAAGVERAVLFGSATQSGESEPPGDLDVLVRLGGSLEGRAACRWTWSKRRPSPIPIFATRSSAQAW